MIKKLSKKIPLVAFPGILCVLLLCILVFLVNFRINAASTGGAIGEGTGTLVGRAIGSLEGLTTGQSEGTKAGKAKGLSAEDTAAELSGKIKEVQKLQVLVASGTYTDMITVGQNKDYAAILSQQYNAVFTVDLATADIALEKDGLHIILDDPIVKFEPLGKYTILNEYQKHGFTGDADSGHQAVLNSANTLRDKVTEVLKGDESMMTAAKTSAEKQLVGLVKAVSLSKPEVIIEWRAK